MLPDACGAGHVALSRGNMLLFQNMTKATAFHTTRTCSCAASILPSGTAVPLLQHRTCRVQRPPHDTPSLLTSSPSLLLFVFVSSTTRVAGRVGTVQPRCLFHVTMSKRSSRALGAPPAKTARPSNDDGTEQAPRREAEASARAAGTGGEAPPTDPIHAGMSDSGGNWQEKLEKAEKTRAEKKGKYEAADKLEKHAAATPSFATFAEYKELKEATATAKAAYEVAQGELAVAQAEKTCAEKKDKYKAAQVKLEKHAAASPSDTTSAGYKKLKEATVTATAAYEVAQGELAVAQAEKTCAKAEKTRAEKKDKYEAADKLEKHAAASPGYAFDHHNALKEATATAKAAYEVAQRELAVAQAEKTCAEKEKDYADAQVKLANPRKTSSDRYKELKKEKMTAYEAVQTQMKVVHTIQAVLQAVREREKAKKRRAEEEKNYEGAQKKLEVYTAAHPDDATSAGYKMLKERELTARAAYEEMTCAEKAKEFAVAQKNLEAYAAAHPSDTPSVRYKELQEEKVTAYEAAQTQVKVAQTLRAVLQAEKEREKAEKRRAEEEKNYEGAQKKLEEYTVAHPDDATSDRYKMLEKATATAKAAYEVAQGELAVAEKKKDYADAQKNLEAYAAAHPSDTPSVRYKELQEEKVTAYAAVQTQMKVVHTNQALLQAEREREKAKKRRAEEEKNYEGVQKKLEVYTAAHPDDATSACYKMLKEWELTARVAYEEMRCAEKKKEFAVVQKSLEAYAAAHPSDTISDRYSELNEEKVTARVAYEAALTQVNVAQGELAVLRAEKEREKAEKRRAEEKKKYDDAQKELEEYVAANPDDATSDRYKMLEKAKKTARDCDEAAQIELHTASVNLIETQRKTRVATQQVCRVTHV